MSEENKENPTVKKRQLLNDLLMKPFSLGWTREVVRRLVTNNRTPNCDIYYFSPSKKRLRSLAEVKCNLTDGLSPECFSFKKEPLGLSPNLETVRDAKARGRTFEKTKEKRKASPSLPKKQSKQENEEEENEEGEDEKEEKEDKVKDGEKEAKKKKLDKEENEEKDLKPAPADTEAMDTNDENEDKSNANNSTENPEVKKDLESESETKSRRARSSVKQPDQSKTFNTKKKTKSKSKTVKPTKPIRLQSVKKRKTVLKKVIRAKQAKQTKLVASRRVLRGIVNKKVASLKRNLSKTKIDKKATMKTKKLKTAKKPLKNIKKTKSEVAKEPETNETDKKSATRDLKSIVKKNIVKYREMREKQKLGVIKPQTRTPSRKIAVATLSRSRLEPISKNKSFYLKPLEKGWRRELVYRTNCAKATRQADVYYFHPSGRKLRSFREISENLTPGLTIECFTFRKEPIGVGEPTEVIRNARSNQKN